MAEDEDTMAASDSYLLTGVSAEEDEARDNFDTAQNQLSKLSITQDDGHYWILNSSNTQISFMSLEAAKPFYKAKIKCDLIVNCCSDKENSPPPLAAVPLVTLKLNESAPAEQIQAQLGVVCSQITDILQLQEARVVFHCEQGKVRSPTIMLLILMLCENVSFMEAYKWVMTINKSIEIMASINAKTSATMVQNLLAA